MGNKSKAKETVEAIGVPIIPGSYGIIENLKECRELANKIEYPIILKASFGGGGKGMRIVNNESKLEHSFLSAQSEAMASFNDDSIYLEKFIKKSRHIEIQILADAAGNTATVTMTDIDASNGVVHVIDTVLMPQ